MILFLKQELLINSEPINQVEKIELESARDIPAASLKVRLNVRKNEDILNIKQGDTVIWKAGYKKNNDTSIIILIEEFRGVITEIMPSKPFEFIAKDDMFLLSLKIIRKNLSQMALKNYASQILTEAGIAASINCDPSVSDKKVSENIAGHSARYALWRLRDPKYGCDVYFKGNTLYIENQFDKKDKDPVALLSFYQDIISDSLKGKGMKSDFGKKKSKGTVLKRLGDDISVEVVSEDVKTGLIKRATSGKGSSKKIYYIDGLDNQEAAKKAKEIYNELTGEGFTGNFTTFGFPSVYSNDVVAIYDKDNEQRSGNCIVEKVTKTYDMSNASYRQIIYPGKFTEPPKRKVSNTANSTKSSGSAPADDLKSGTIIDAIHAKYDELKEMFPLIKRLK